MSTAKEEVHALLTKLPDDCSLADIQYHLCVIEKVRHGLEVADSQGAIPQGEVHRCIQTARYTHATDEGLRRAMEALAQRQTYRHKSPRNSRRAAGACRLSY